MNSNFLVGGDPEFPLYHKGFKKFISFEDYVKGTKKNPEKIEVKGCFQQLDCTGIEFTLPPAPEYWMYKTIIDNCIIYTNDWLKKIDNNLEMIITSSCEYSYDQLQSESARTFGCEPSYSVYRNNISSRPDPDSINFRSFGYHIHYGFDREYSKGELRSFMILNDIYLGFPSLWVDQDNRRRKLYGNLSDHRIISKEKNYDKIQSSNRVEYRVLGAGIHNNSDFVENGINLIKSNIHRMTELVDKYYNYLKDVDDSNYDVEVCNVLKDLMIKNNDFNG